MPRSSLVSVIKKVNGFVDFRGYGRNAIDSVIGVLDQRFPEYFSLYAFVLHDRDINDNGDVKTPHIHIVGVLPKKKRLSTIINDIAGICGVNPLAVTLDGLASFEGSFQYLIHKHQPEKYQYPIEAVHTNLDKAEIDRILETSASALDFERLYAICNGSKNLIEVMETVGLSLYSHYRTAIVDLWQFIQDENKNTKGF